MQTMRPEELNAVRTGAAQSLKEVIAGTKRTANATDKLIDKPALEQRIRTVFGDDETFQKYVNGLENEKAMYQTYAEVKKGSQTAERLAADADLNGPVSALAEVAPAAISMMRPSSGLAQMATLMRLAGDRYNRAMLPEPVRNRIAQILTQQGTGGLAEAAARRQAMDQNKRLLSGILTNELGTGYTTQTNR